MDVLVVFSHIFGWIYFFSWSFSFYGQVMENFLRKHVKGIMFEYFYLNFFGYLFYSLYTTFGKYDSVYGKATGHIAYVDIIFAWHGFALTCMTIGQILYYPKEKGQNVGMWCILVMLGMNLAVCITAALVATHIVGRDSSWSFVSVFGYNKIVVSGVKYVPQAWKNYKRKSTVGWNIHNVILDFMGGFFSFAQLLVDSIHNNNHGNIFAGGFNIAKFGLAVESLIFDTIFLFQHYCLYHAAYLADPLFKKKEQGTTLLTIKAQEENEKVEEV